MVGLKNIEVQLYTTFTKMKGVTLMFKRLKNLFVVLISFLLVFTVLPGDQTTIQANAHDKDLWKVVNPLNTTVSFMNTGAHPDDERSDFLAYLSLGHGVETTSIIANRGEGGQNQIGLELGDQLGIIRSNEMIEASKLTNIKTYHLSQTTADSIYDFGFSKTYEETLEKWGEEETYRRFIRQIRILKPDVIMAAARNVPSQHGHHQAMSYLSEKAFEDAGNPNVFPEQIEKGISAWQPKKFYWPASEEEATESIEIGNIDQVYGLTYPQLGEESRYMHKSQGMGRDLPVEPRKIHLELRGNATAIDGSFFEGIPYDFNDWAALVNDEGVATILEDLQAELKNTIDYYPSHSEVFVASQKALETLYNAVELVENAKIDADIKEELFHKLSVKEEQLNLANFVASEVEVEATISSPTLVQGQEATVDVYVKNNGEHMIENFEIDLLVADGWNVSNLQEVSELQPGEETTFTSTVHVPGDAALFHPYDDAVLEINVNYSMNGVSINTVEAVDETIAVLPDIGLTLDPENLVVNTADVQDEILVTVLAENFRVGQTEASVSLEVPEGWKVSSDESQNVTFSEKHEQKELEFKVIPADDVQPGPVNIDAKATINGKVLNDTVQKIEYDHIDESYFIYPAQVDGVAFELLMDENLKVGYVDSGMDKIADLLVNIGMDVTRLTEEDLKSANLNEYDTIVTGIRAYMSRADLVENNDRLLEYVENGGNLVVQHNLPGEWDRDTTAPYPLTIGTPSIEWRVTDQTSKVTMTQLDSSLFNYPNKIVDSDWDNWVQERGLYFPMEWDERYETFVSMADPNEDPFTSGILQADYGEGSYIYTNLVFYRQIQGQVPGGYRIFTNLIHYNHEEEIDELTIKEVFPLDKIHVDKGTAEKNLDLPELVTILLSDDLTMDVPVNWENSTPLYDGDTAGFYTFEGTLVLPDTVKNTHDLSASVTVVVEDDKDETGEKDPGEENGDKIDPTEKNGDKQDSDKDDSGGILPKTATNLFNSLLIGLIILLAGSGLYYWNRRRKYSNI